MFLVLIGLFGLWLGTRWVIAGALGLAKRYSLSHSFVGLGILALGTDLPEVFVSLNASMLHLKGIESSGIITGNAIGSSISQITVILGITGLLLSFRIEKKDFNRDAFFLLSSITLLYVFGFDGLINRLEGAILIATYLVYYIILFREGHTNEDDNASGKVLTIPWIVFNLILGLSVLIYSSHVVVKNAMMLAEHWGVAQSFVGIAIIGLGTSLPELAVSIGAAINKSPKMTVGNIVGSNIFDGLIPIGLGGAISTTNMEDVLLTFDLPFTFVVTLIVLLFLRTKRGISTIEGIILILIYLAYIYLKMTVF